MRSFRKAYEKTTHVFVVNTVRTPASAMLTLPSRGLRVSVDGTAQKLKGSGRTVQVDLAPLGVGHVEVR